MQIILVSSRLGQARTVQLGWWHVAAAIVLAGAAVVSVGSALAYFGLVSGTALRIPIVERLVATIHDRDTKRNEAFVRENISALAVKLGDLQAQVARLDAIGERVVAMSGIKVRDLKFGETPGRGGAPASSAAMGQISFDELGKELETLTVRMDNRSDHFRVLEDELLRERARATLVPSAAPLNVPYQVSGFGWRIDPFTGRRAMHEGIDFAAPVGTPILAAAAGIVITAEFHPSYGNMIEVDHGNRLVTRYAHASRLTAKVGDLVKRGQKIAEVGSTGHSTGPHLHFEVRESGVAQNPSKFLTAATK